MAKIPGLIMVSEKPKSLVADSPVENLYAPPMQIMPIATNFAHVNTF